MSDRIVNYYEFPERTPDWLKLKQMFKRNVSKYNYPYFEANSELERDFLRYCEASNLTVHKGTLIEYDREATETGKFLFLCVKDDGGDCISESGLGFVDSSAACPGGDAFGICGRGARQVDKVSIRSQGGQKIQTLGLLTARHPNVPKIYLSSAEVAEVLTKAKASGCEIVPTGRQDCYQLRITAETAGPTRIGNARMGRRCPVCGVAKMFLSSSERYFHRGDLKPTDFQICRLYAADNVGQFEILNGFPIVSQRIFNLLLELKIEGLDRYSTDPPIQHAVVQVCNL
jgi:hypothetical protein